MVGKYRIVRDLGMAGMAHVSLAVLEGPGGFSKTYVVKRISPEHVPNPRLARMLAEEAKIAASLDHSNVVRVFELDEDGGSYFLVMEHVDGASLDQLLRETRKSGFPLGPDLALEIGLPLARALAHAHGLKRADGKSLDLVHRDVSPGNVLISREGAVKLTNFGVANSAIGTTAVTGGINGKLSYMSPEQLKGAVTDHRSDLFSLGVVLHEVATGVRLVRGDSAPAPESSAAAATTAFPGVLAGTLTTTAHPPLAAVIARLLRREPSARYQRAAALVADLEALWGERPARTGSTPLADAVRGFLAATGASPPPIGPIFVTPPPISSSNEEAPAQVAAVAAPAERPADEEPPLPSPPPPAPQLAPSAAAAFDGTFDATFDGRLDPATGDQVSVKLVLAVSLACLICSLVFWFVVF